MIIARCAFLGQPYGISLSYFSSFYFDSSLFWLLSISRLSISSEWSSILCLVNGYSCACYCCIQYNPVKFYNIVSAPSRFRLDPWFSVFCDKEYKALLVVDGREVRRYRGFEIVVFVEFSFESLTPQNRKFVAKNRKFVERSPTKMTSFHISVTRRAGLLKKLWSTAIRHMISP